VSRVAAALALAALLAGCGTDCTPPPGADRPNVVLVTIDTLRADHLGCYGSVTARTPHLDRLAGEGALFEHAWAQTHITVPSHLSLLSSLPLATHGVWHNDARVRRRVDVLPELFARAGYHTAAFVSAKHVGPEGVLGPLFPSLEEYRAPRRMSVPFRAAETNAHLFRWLRGVCREPFFAWVHYFDPHMPYTPPPPFDTAYYAGNPRDPAASGMEQVVLGWDLHAVEDVPRVLGRRAAAVRALKRELALPGRRLQSLILYPVDLETYVDGPEARVRLRHQLADVAATVRRALPVRAALAGWLVGLRDLRYPLAQYAGEVSYVDQEIGRLRAELERLGVAGRTILVVTADHGESLGEHGVWFNHFGLTEQNLRVPLVVWAPARVAPARHPGAASGLDVAPTILRLADLPVPPAMQGRDLLAPAAAEPGTPIVAEALRGLQIAARRGPWKLVRTLRSFCYVDAFQQPAGAQELYRLDDDPGERQNLIGGYPEVTATLARSLETWMAEHASAPDGEPARPARPGLERELRALGYVQ